MIVRIADIRNKKFLHNSVKSATKVNLSFAIIDGVDSKFKAMFEKRRTHKILNCLVFSTKLHLLRFDG